MSSRWSWYSRPDAFLLRRLAGSPKLGSRACTAIVGGRGASVATCHVCGCSGNSKTSSRAVMCRRLGLQGATAWTITRDTHQLLWILISTAGQIRKPYPPNNPPKFLSTSFLVSCMQHASFLPMRHMNIYMQPMHAALFPHACMQHHTLLLSFFFLSSFEQLVPVLDGTCLGLPLLICSGTGLPCRTQLGLG